MTTSESPFSLHIEAGVAHVVLSRTSKANAMGPAFWEGLPKLIDEISQSASARCIVISARGRHFTSGMDLATLIDLPLGKPGDRHLQSEAFLHELGRLQDAFNALERARMPVIAAIQGACVGAGVDMVSACDIRLCAEDAWFSIHEINIGMTADVGTFPRLTRLMPEGWVRQLAYTGQKLDAKTARQLGFVNCVYKTHDELVMHALSIAREIALRDPLAVAGSKEMLNYARDHSTQDALRYVGVWNSAMLSPERLQESFAAQMEKRAAKYPDLISVARSSLKDGDEGGAR